MDEAPEPPEVRQVLPIAKQPEVILMPFAKVEVEIPVTAREVLVALVVVLFSPVKFCKVVEPVTSRVAKLFAPEKVLLFARRVEEAAVIAELQPN